MKSVTMVKKRPGNVVGDLFCFVSCSDEESVRCLGSSQ